MRTEIAPSRWIAGLALLATTLGVPAPAPCNSAGLAPGDSRQDPGPPATLLLASAEPGSGEPSPSSGGSAAGECPDEQGGGEGTYGVFILTNVSGGSIWVGEEKGMENRAVGSFDGGGMCKRLEDGCPRATWRRVGSAYRTAEEAARMYCGNLIRTFSLPLVPGFKAETTFGTYWAETTPDCKEAGIAPPSKEKQCQKILEIALELPGGSQARAGDLLEVSATVSGKQNRGTGLVPLGAEKANPAAVEINYDGRRVADGQTDKEGKARLCFTVPEDATSGGAKHELKGRAVKEWFLPGETTLETEALPVVKRAVILVSPELGTIASVMARPRMAAEVVYLKAKGYELYRGVATVENISQVLMSRKVHAFSYFGHGSYPSMESLDADSWKSRVRIGLLMRYAKMGLDPDDGAKRADEGSRNFGLELVRNHSCYALKDNSLANLMAKPGGLYYGSPKGYLPLPSYKAWFGWGKAPEGDMILSEYKAPASPPGQGPGSTLCPPRPPSAPGTAPGGANRPSGERTIAQAQAAAGPALPGGAGQALPASLPPHLAKDGLDFLIPINEQEMAALEKIEREGPRSAPPGAADGPTGKDGAAEEGTGTEEEAQAGLGDPWKACGRTLPREIHTKWADLGGEKGPLGCPTSEAEGVVLGTEGMGLYVGFQGRGGSALFAHLSGPRKGEVHELHGCILEAFRDHEGPGAWLGLPVSDVFVTQMGYRADFEAGYVTANPLTEKCEARRHGSAGER